MSTRKHRIERRSRIARSTARVLNAPFYDVRTDACPPLWLPDLWRVVDAPVGEVRIVAEPGRLTVILPTSSPPVPVMTTAPARNFHWDELRVAAGVVAVG